MTLNPEILQWARNTAGLSADQAARALDFKNTRDRSAEQRLMALEAGDEQPSRSVLQKMAKAYRRSLLVFYLAQPPRIADRGQDFRTVPGAAPPLYDPILDALIRDIRGRQTLVKSLVEDEDAQPVKFVGSVSISVPAQKLLDQIKATLQFSLDGFRRQPTVESAFGYLRQKIEDTGVFVLLSGNLGSHHTNIPVEIFRGFAIADPLAPFIVINDQDAHAAWSFTALHELTHLWLGTTGISGESTEAWIEQYCNEVAGEILLPTAEINRLAVRGKPLSEAISAISTFATARKITRAMVAYKLLRSEVIEERTWRQLSDHFRREWIENRRKQAKPDDDGESGGPSYYVVRRHRLGNAILELARRSISDGKLTYTRAAQMLGVKPRNVDPLIHGTSPQMRRS